MDWQTNYLADAAAGRPAEKRHHLPIDRCWGSVGCGSAMKLRPVGWRDLFAAEAEAEAGEGWEGLWKTAVFDL